MELVNEFTVNRPIDEAWAVLTDVERIAPCMPGAQLQQIEGDIFRGVVKVKVGPISAALKGEATFVERDDSKHRAVLKADGRDTKGNGNASAMITASLQELTPTSAKCVVHTDLNMTGKVAQFGRGALADISSKLMQHFATNLDEMLAKDGSTDEAQTAGAADDKPTAGAALEAEAPAPAAKKKAAENKAAENKASETPAVEPSADSADSAGAAGAAKGPTVRHINGPAAEPIDAFKVGGHAVLKRVLPLFGGLVILLLALRRLRK